METTAQEKAQEHQEEVQGPTNTLGIRNLEINSSNNVDIAEDNKVTSTLNINEETLGLPVQSDKEMDRNELAFCRRVFSNTYVQEIIAASMSRALKLMEKKDEGLEVNNVQVVRKIMMKPQTYDGTSDWLNYLTHFENVAKYNGWDEYDKLAWLGGSLRGEAMGTLSRLDELDEESYSSLVHFLNLRFGTDVEVYQHILKKRVRQADETLLHLANDIRTLVQRAYPTGRDIWEMLAINHFVDAIPDYKTSFHVYVSCPETLEEALNVAISVEGFGMLRKIRDQCKGTLNPGHTEHECPNELDMLTSKVSSLSLRNHRPIKSGTKSKVRPKTVKVQVDDNNGRGRYACQVRCVDVHKVVIKHKRKSPSTRTRDWKRSTASVESRLDRA